MPNKPRPCHPELGDDAIHSVPMLNLRYPSSLLASTSTYPCPMREKLASFYYRKRTRQIKTIICLDLSILYVGVSLARRPVTFQMNSFNRANAVSVVSHNLEHV